MVPVPGFATRVCLTIGIPGYPPINPMVVLYTTVPLLEWLVYHISRNIHISRNERYPTIHMSKRQNYCNTNLVLLRLMSWPF